MARKKTSKKASRKKAAGKRSGKSLTTYKAQLPANWREQLAADAEEEADRTPAGTGDRITLNRDGTFSFQGASLGESFRGVIVDHVFCRQYFEGEYDEDNPTPPTCFALKVTDKNIAPHENSPELQAEACADCWANEWASGRKRGKACKEKHRLAILHADDLGGDLIKLETPVTTGGGFRKYIKGLTKAADVPSYAVVTQFSMDEHADWQKVDFEFVDKLPEDQLGVVMGRRKQAREMLLEPYDTSGYEEGKKKKGSSKKTTRKKPSRKKSSARSPRGGSARRAANKKRSRMS